MRVWLDDERPMPSGFDVHVKTAKALLALLYRGTVNFVSFDHDLGTGPTGYDAAKEIERAAFKGTIKPPEFDVHSANPVGAQNIIQAMHSAHIWWRRHSGR